MIVWEKPSNQFLLIALKGHHAFIDNKRVISYAGGALTKGASNKVGTALKFEKVSYTLRRDRKREKEETASQIAEQQAQIQELMSLVNDQKDTITSLMGSQDKTATPNAELVDLKKLVQDQQKQLDALKEQKTVPKPKAKPATEQAEE